MRRVVLAVLLLAGCTQLQPEGPATVEPSHVEETSRGPDEYWMVWAHGTERSTCEGPFCSRAICSVLFDHEVVAAQRAFRHANRSAPERPWVVVAFDHFTDGDCPLAYGHAFDATRVTARMGEWGDLTLEVLPGGDVRANGHDVPLGQRATWRYDPAGFEGEFHVENLGAWPTASLRGPD